MEVVSAAKYGAGHDEFEYDGGREEVTQHEHCSVRDGAEYGLALSKGYVDLRN